MASSGNDDINRPHPDPVDTEAVDASTSIPTVIEKPCNDKAVLKHFAKKMIKAGSIFDTSGFLKFAMDKRLAKRVIQRLESSGLYNFVTFNYTAFYPLEVAQFYLNATIPTDEEGNEIDEIRSSVNRQDVRIVYGDIRTTFQFPQYDDTYFSSYTSHEYDRDDFWDIIKAPNQPSSVHFPIKKKMLKMDYEYTIDILNKIVESRQSGTDDISERKLRMLNALLNNYRVDWSQVVFDFLLDNIRSGVDVNSGKITRVLGFGFMISELLKSKGIVLKDGVPPHRTHYHMKSKPPKYDERKAEALGLNVSAPPQTKSKTSGAVAKRKAPEPSRKAKRSKKAPKVAAKQPSKSIKLASTMPAVPPIVQPAVQPSPPDYSSDDELPLARVVSKAQKRKAPEPTKEVSHALVKKPMLGRDGQPLSSVSWTSSSDESTEGEDSEVNQPSIHHPSSPTQEAVSPEHIQDNVQPATLPQEPARTDEVARENIPEEAARPEPLVGDEAEASEVRQDIPSQIDADAELAQQLAQEELHAAAEEDTVQSSHEETLRAELKRVYDWQKWRMSSLAVIAETLDFMWEEEEWALQWMGTQSVFAATRPEEIDRVFQEKLVGRDANKGKGRAVDNEPSPAELARADKRLLRRVQLLSKFQEQFIDRSPGVGTSQAAEAMHNSADDSDTHTEEAHPELQLIIYQEPITTTPISREDAPARTSDESLMVLDIPLHDDNTDVPRPSPSLARDENLEASRGASQDDIEPSSENPSQLPQSSPRHSSSSARDENLEASRGASHDDFRPRDDSHFQTSPFSPKPDADSSLILSELKRMADEQNRHFKSIKKSLRRAKKVSMKEKSQEATVSSNPAFEELMLKAQANNAVMFENILEALSGILKEQKAAKANQLELQERLNLSCLKLDFVNENVNVSGSNVLHTQWELNEIKAMVARLTDMIASALGSQDDANKGERLSCTAQGFQSLGRRDDDDEERGRGRRSHPMAYPRDILTARPHISRTPSSPRGDSRSKPSSTRQRTTLTAEGIEVPYEPYEQGSGLRFRGCNIPPNLKSKSNLERQEYQFRRNQEIIRAEELRRQAEAEALEQQRLEIIRFSKMKEEVAAMETIRRSTSDQIILQAIIQIMNKTGQSFYEGMNAPELICWWKRRILEGRNIIEATKNYFEFKLAPKYKDLTEERSIREIRKAINDEIDRADLVEREKQERGKK